MGVCGYGIGCATSLGRRAYAMSLPPTVLNDVQCPRCGYRGATVLFDQWIRLFLRCQRCEHLWSEEKPDTYE